jgi:hypothetical protein
VGGADRRSAPTRSNSIYAKEMGVLLGSRHADIQREPSSRNSTLQGIRNCSRTAPSAGSKPRPALQGDDERLLSFRWRRGRSWFRGRLLLPREAGGVQRPSRSLCWRFLILTDRKFGPTDLSLRVSGYRSFGPLRQHARPGPHRATSRGGASAPSRARCAAARLPRGGRAAS